MLALTLIACLVLMLFVRTRLLEPARIMAGYWCVQYLASVALFPDTFVNFTALVIPAASILVFTGGVYLATPSRAATTTDTSLTSFALAPQAIKWLRVLLITTALAGLAVASLAPGHIDLVGGDIASQVASVGNANSKARYNGGGAVGLAVPILLGVVYLGALTLPLGAHLTVGKVSRYLYSLVPSLAILPHSLVTTEKAPFVEVVALSLGSWLAFRVLVKGGVPRVTLRFALKSAALAALLVLSVLVLNTARLGSFTPETFRVGYEKMSAYFFLSLPAYTFWDESIKLGLAPEPPLAYGSSSFSPVSFLVPSEREILVSKAYDDQATLSGFAQPTNVYTFFRNTRTDFGLVGQVIFFAIWGFSFGRLYQRARHGSLWSASLLGSFYSVIFMSTAMMMTSFTNVSLAVIAAVMVCLFLSRYRTSSQDPWATEARPLDVSSRSNPRQIRLASRPYSPRRL